MHVCIFMCACYVYTCVFYARESIIAYLHARENVSVNVSVSVSVRESVSVSVCECECECE